jgi:quercetin 2,3-dioxygenase
MGITTLAFKVATADTGAGLFVIEQTNHAKGGPPRHVHPDQDEWFYAVEGEFVVEVGGRTERLFPGDSLLAPRSVPHVWAFVGDGIGRLIVAFTPAGRMEAFFREVTKTEAMPVQDPALWLAHGMRVVGPPLTLE